MQRMKRVIVMLLVVLSILSCSLFVGCNNSDGQNGNANNGSSQANQSSQVYTKLKNYIVRNGEYDSVDRNYCLFFDIENGESFAYMTGAYYYIDDGEISLTLYVDNDATYHYITLDILKINGVYTWSYLDENNRFVTGNVYGSTFSKSSTLGYINYSGIYSTSVLNSVIELASTMMRVLLLKIEIDYSSIGITAKDLGFIYFS